MTVRAVTRWRAGAGVVALCMRAAGLGLLMMAAAALAAPASSAVPTEIRRTTGGVPHIRAANWQALGEGMGHAQARDALCTLAEAFVTYRGERSWFFGADSRPARLSIYGRPANLDLDVFFRTHLDAAAVARWRAAQPPALMAAIEGYAAGYNRQVDAARADAADAQQPPCVHEPWVRRIEADDLLRRMVSAGMAAGYARFLPALVRAAPPAADASADLPPDAGTPAGQAPAEGTSSGRASPARAGDTDTALASRRRVWAQQVGQQAGLGSNMLAFGARATGEPSAVLFGNPHWYWSGPDRFYQMHLSIPGQLDVAGVAFLGVPMVMIGFNNDVAWSHTVSNARRFGLFDLTLDPADPTRYMVDGRSVAMSHRDVIVPVRGADGRAQHVTRRVYGTRYGPLVDLGAYAPGYGWTRTHALAMRDVNADNLHAFRVFFAWNRARTLDEFIAIQRREAGVPWVYTTAIARGDGRVWLGDIGAVPNVPDRLRAACATPRTRAFAAVDAAVPFLDGSRSACDWGRSPMRGAAARSAMLPASAQPGLLRDDYVANMNDSYWLSNPHRPLEGYAAVMGGERQPLSLRGRLGHRIAQELSAQPSSAEALSQRLMQAVLLPRAWSAALFKDELLAPWCPAPEDQRLDAACRVLHAWSGRAEATSRGALLWDAFWSRLEVIPSAEFWRVPFTPDAPLDTPRAPRADDPRVGEALKATVDDFAARGWALDAPLGSRRHVQPTGAPAVPLYGGCHGAGYFTVVCDGDGSHPVGADAVANSYLQVVRFGPQGVVAHTLLAHGEDEAGPGLGRGGAEALAHYAQKQWLPFPFREEDIAREPALETTVLSR